jgi:predicted nucleic acid-binding Zn ribbon protein
MARTRDEDARWLAGLLPAQSQRRPKHIAEVLSRLMSRRGYAQVQFVRECEQIWNQAAGQWARRTRPGRFARGVLEVVVQDSATLQELTFQKKELLAAVQRLAPQFRVQQLRFKVGDVSG